MSNATTARILSIIFTLAAATGCDRTQSPRDGNETPAAKVAPKAAPMNLLFADITARSGIDFRHENGGTGQKYLPETMGAGAAFLDYDGDGKLDLFFVGSGPLPGAESAPAPAASPCRLYRGHGDGTFEDVSEAAACNRSLYGMGVAVADYDADGDEDIYVTGLDGNLLLRNDGGRFADATREAGVRGGTWRDRDGREHAEWSTAAAWFDADRDGDLDLFVGNYVEWTPAGEVFTTMDGTHKVFTTPDRYPGLPCRLFVNDGNGRFRDGSEAAGLLGAKGKALGVALWDFDGNGALDVVVANDTQPNFFFENEGKGVFRERGLTLGIAYDETGRARAGMGIDIADYGCDGVPGVAIANFSMEPMSLYRWQPGGHSFSSVAGQCGLAAATYGSLKFGTLFLDLDLDGRQDIVVANGHIEPDIARYRAGETHAQPAQLFQGIEGATFLDRSRDVGPDFAVPRVGRGVLAGDIDGDGDLDLVITANDGAPVLLENRPARTAEARRYLRVVLSGKEKNRHAVGARVTLSAGGHTQVRTIRTGSSYLSQSEWAATFGLGAAATTGELRITWPSGKETTHAITAANTTLTIDEP